jgi:hypothetical protein
MSEADTAEVLFERALASLPTAGWLRPPFIAGISARDVAMGAQVPDGWVYDTLRQHWLPEAAR